MKKITISEAKIMALAYLHRYGWVAAMLVCIAIWLEQMMYILSAGCIVFSMWSFIGYKCKWKHIYCSFQDSYHQEMTPKNIQWHKVKKRDAYGIPLFFFILGLVLLIIVFVD